MADRIAACMLCSLHQARTRTVPGQGCPAPEILFVGEAPGAEEDKQGLAFVGAAGQLLTKMIEAMGCTRDQVFIANILKCRPPNNRPPLPEEMATCLPYLREQIGILKPKVIVALGATAVRGLLTVETKISALRGHWFTFEGIDLMPTFHPAYLLRNPSAKRDAWDDLKAVLAKLGRTAPSGKKSTP
jgi:DNA polymerase